MTRDDKGDPAPSLTGSPLADALLAYWPGARLDYKRHYELPDDTSPAFRATFEHLLRLLDRAKGAERDEIDLRINVLVAEEQARLLAERAARVASQSMSDTEVDLDTPLARRVSPVVRDLWGADPDAPDAAPTQDDVARELGYKTRAGLAKQLGKEPGLWRALTSRRPR